MPAHDERLSYSVQDGGILDVVEEVRVDVRGGRDKGAQLVLGQVDFIVKTDCTVSIRLCERRGGGDETIFIVCY